MSTGKEKDEVTALLTEAQAANLTPQYIAERIAEIYASSSEQNSVEDEENYAEEAYLTIQKSINGTPTIQLNLNELELLVLTLVLEAAHTSDIDFAIYNEIANHISEKLPNTKLRWSDVGFNGTREDAKTLKEMLGNR